MDSLATVALRRTVCTLLLASLGCATSQLLGGDSACTAWQPARYSLTFTGKWSQTAFPKQYPLFRPPAQWSSLLGKGSSAAGLPAESVQPLDNS